MILDILQFFTRVRLTFKREKIVLQNYPLILSYFESFYTIIPVPSAGFGAESKQSHSNWPGTMRRRLEDNGGPADTWRPQGTMDFDREHAEIRESSAQVHCSSKQCEGECTEYYQQWKFWIFWSPVSPEQVCSRTDRQFWVALDAIHLLGLLMRIVFESSYSVHFVWSGVLNLRIPPPRKNPGQIGGDSYK